MKKQRGSTAIEFSLILMLFLSLVFGVIELARLMFLYNTLQEVTRRAASAAAVTDFSNASAMERIRWDAIFRDSAGGLVLMPELTDQAIRIDYMTIKRNDDGTLAMEAIGSGALPATPAENRKTCAFDPNGASCIRLVRVRVCDPANTASCDAMPFTTLTTIIKLELPLPIATTLAKAQSLGM